MALKMTFEVDGDKQLVRALSRFGKDVRDLRPAFKQIAASFFAIEQKQFQSEGGYGSGGWRPLSPSYAEWKELNFPGKPILQRTGLMMSSLTGQTSDTIMEIKPLQFRIGTRLGYAAYHQSGTPSMPARRPIDLTEADKQEWMKILQRFLVETSRKAGLR